ncbi:MAG: GNAT family N-acetyltransferase [Anaerolineae bacterium]|nr:GNAT family N-acetyltransferase [Anaerolineae bacterium]
MTAALTQPHRTAQPGDGLSRTKPGRDLFQIAELVEKCFSSGMDAGGRSAIQEMKFIARLWPLTWPLIILDRPGLGTGFVWRIGGHVIGNASLYPGGAHPWLGPGWLVANVAVHPDYRRQGIALSLMRAGIEFVREQRGRWIALQVDAANTGAQELYKKLGFTGYETLGIWERTGLHQLVSSADANTWHIRSRRSQDIATETDLIYNRARLGAMNWGHPIERSQLQGGLLSDIGKLLGGQYQDHRVLPDPDRPNRLLGVLWIDMSGWHAARLSLFLDPDLRDPDGRQSLLRWILDNHAFEGWSLRLETVAEDNHVEEMAQAAGFRKTHNLTQMRCLL